MTDRLVRSAFHQTVLQWTHHCENTFVINELGIKNGTYRADIAVLNGKIIGYEIKTENDTLSRLPSQAEAYSQIFNEVFLIVAENHLQNALEIVPKWWGIYLIKPLCEETYYFEYIRESQSNLNQDTFSIAQLLWKDEALEIANTVFNCNIKNRSTRKEIYGAISAACKTDNLGEIVIDYLKKRETWRKDRKAP
jgi:hypothetical protein